MLVEHVSVRNPFEGFTQGAVTYQQVGHKVNEQQLPGGQVQTVLYEYAGYEQQAAARAPLFMMMVLVFAMLAMMIVMLVLMMMLVLAMMIVLMMLMLMMMLMLAMMIVMM